jgi:hypothetical protein
MWSKSIDYVLVGSGLVLAIINIAYILVIYR